MKARTSSIMSEKWLQITLIFAVFIMTLYETKVAGQQCVPACNDDNPCTVDQCVNGQCVFTAICTITLTHTPAPSITPKLTNGPGSSVTRTPNKPVTASLTPSPQPVTITVTRSRIPLNPSSASQALAPSASATGGVPSGFPIQSVSSTINPSRTISTTPAHSISPSTSVTSAITPTPNLSPAASFSPSATLTSPSPSTSSVPATPLPYRVGAPVTVLVQLECTAADCCSNFVAAWASLVDINDVSLMDLLTCDAINSNLYAVTYNQFGSNFYDAYQILSRYWVGGHCGSIEPLNYAPCFPGQGLLYSYDWDNVVEINILNADYLSTYTTNYSTANLTYYSFPVYPSTSSAFLLSPSFLLFALSFLFALAL